MYLIGLKALLGKVQEEYQKTVKLSQRMPGGRVHLWAMLDYNKPCHIPFPETIMEAVKKIDSPSIQKFAFAGWKRLQLSSIQAIESANTVRVEGMTEEQFKADTKSAKKDRLDEQQDLKQIIHNMEIGKPWGSFRGDISWWANQ